MTRNGQGFLTFFVIFMHEVDYIIYILTKRSTKLSFLLSMRLVMSGRQVTFFQKIVIIN